MKKEKIEAFKTLFGFDITDFDSMCTNSCMSCLFSLEDARKVKKAYETLKKDFGWKKEFSIYEYYEGAYAVDCPNDVEGNHKKIEQLKSAPSWNSPAWL